MSWLSDLKRDLTKLSKTMIPRAERLPASGLAANYGGDSSSGHAGVRNISTSGVYLVTEKRLPTGEMITLTLQENEKQSNHEALQFSVHARVARQGDDGLGLSFDLPPGLDATLWEVLVRNMVLLNDPAEIAEIFHTLRAVLFMCRLCQSGAEEGILLLGGQLDSNRTATLVKLALAAERLLDAEPDGDRMHAHPRLVANILREGSWAPEELTMKLWAGLLAASCSVTAPDDSNQVFVNLLVNMTPIQARILVHGCERALKSKTGDEDSASESIVLMPQEMIDLTGIHELARNATDVNYLYNLGMIRNVFDFTSYLPVESFDITPSDMGLTLYRHCHGSREKVDPEFAKKAEANLLHFLPPPHPPLFDGRPPKPLS